MCRDDPAGEIAFSSGVHCVVGDVITHAKFYANWFRGFGVLTTPTLPFSIGLVGCPYNSVSITVQHCDSITALRLVNHDVTQLNIHRESKKGCHPNDGYNFVNSWWICKILSLLQRAVKFQQNQY